MLNMMQQNAARRMEKSVENLAHELIKIRTGRANPSFLDHVLVDYYGNLVPINQVAAVSTSDSRTLLVTPWEKSMVATVEKAILNADLGLNPATSGAAIRVPMPALTQERRKEMIKIARSEAELARIAIRNIRRDANNQSKELVKSKEISEDDEHRMSEIIQNLTDKYIAKVDIHLTEKEKDLMEI